MPARRRTHPHDLPARHTDAGLLVRLLDGILSAAFLMLATPVDTYLKAMMGEPEEDYVYRDN